MRAFSWVSNDFESIVFSIVLAKFDLLIDIKYFGKKMNGNFATNLEITFFNMYGMSTKSCLQTKHILN